MGERFDVCKNVCKNSKSSHLVTGKVDDVICQLVIQFSAARLQTQGLEPGIAGHSAATGGGGEALLQLRPGHRQQAGEGQRANACTHQIFLLDLTKMFYAKFAAYLRKEIWAWQSWCRGTRQKALTAWC